MLAIKNIFLADDDSDDLFLFQEALREINTSVSLTIADNGEELTEKLSRSTVSPQMIFLDLNMPLKNGFDCLDEIRSTSQYKEIPVIVLSTSGSQSSIDASYHKGADMYIQKPDNYKDLKKALNICLTKDWNSHTRPPGDDFLLRIHN